MIGLSRVKVMASGPSRQGCFDITEGGREHAGEAALPGAARDQILADLDLDIGYAAFDGMYWDRVVAGEIDLIGYVVADAQLIEGPEAMQQTVGDFRLFAMDHANIAIPPPPAKHTGEAVH